jgi:ankyrin repeat protein
LPIAVRLLEAGANGSAPGAENDGRTALEGAAEWGRLEMVHLLLNNDGEVDTLEERCEGAAKYADKEGHVVIARVLRGWKDR